MLLLLLLLMLLKVHIAEWDEGGRQPGREAHTLTRGDASQSAKLEHRDIDKAESESAILEDAVETKTKGGSPGLQSGGRKHQLPACPARPG